MRKEELSSEEGESEMQLTSTPIIDPTGSDPPFSDDIQGMFVIVQEDDHEIIIAAVKMSS